MRGACQQSGERASAGPSQASELRHAAALGKQCPDSLFITITDNFVYMDDFFSICSITAVFTSAVSSESENI